jgi:hypothetical protein
VKNWLVTYNEYLDEWGVCETFLHGEEWRSIGETVKGDYVYSIDATVIEADDPGEALALARVSH